MVKVLIIRFSSIGDIVLTTPVIRCLKKQLNGAEIHFLTKKNFLTVLESNPYIDKLLTIENDIGEILADLHVESYDHIIDLHKNFRSKRILQNLKRPSTSFNKLNISKWLMVNFKINRLPDIHIVDRYFHAVGLFNVKNDGLGLDYFIPAEEEVDLKTLPQGFQNGYVGWVIGGMHKTKIFPVDRIIAVCKNVDKPIILLGGKDDFENGERIKREVGKAIYNACGKLSINQSASLVQKADKIISNDTGLMHIAAAFGKKIISLWGNTIPEFGMYPYFPENKTQSDIVEIKKLSCRPCSKIGFKKCPRKHFDCMNKIDSNELCRLINS